MVNSQSSPIRFTSARHTMRSVFCDQFPLQSGTQGKLFDLSRADFSDRRELHLSNISSVSVGSADFILAVAILR